MVETFLMLIKQKCTSEYVIYNLGEELIGKDTWPLFQPRLAYGPFQHLPC